MDIDDIIIKPKNNNFLELLEQNINNGNYQIQNNNNISNKPFRKYKPPPKKNILLTIPKKNEIKKYRYYTDNFKKKKKSKNNLNEDDEAKKEETKNINKSNLEEDNIKFTKEIINDFFVKKYLDDNQKQEIKSDHNLLSKSNIKDNIENNKNEVNSLVGNKEKKNKNKNKIQEENLGFLISVQNNSEVNKLNKNINHINISSSINNLKGFSSKGSNNFSSITNQSINYQIISDNLPHDESMQKDINNILNLNNNVDTNEKKKFNTIQNMTHSHSTKSFAFRKRVKQQNQSTLNYFDPEQIINTIEKTKNFANNKNDIKDNNINKLENDLNKIKEEYSNIKKEKINYENLNRIIQSDIRNFNKQKKIDQENFEKYKNDKKKLLTNEKNKIFYENQKLNELKKKYQEHNNDIEVDENIDDNKKIIEIYKAKLEEANNKILQLKIILNQLELNNDNNDNDTKNNNNNNFENISLEEFDESEDNDDDNYELYFPPKYHNSKYNLLKTENVEGKIKNIYDKNKIEIISNGEKREIFDDKYEIIYFNNGDIKQIFKEIGKEVLYLYNQKIIKTKLKKGLLITKYDTGQIEKSFSDGTKKIAFPDGSLRYIFPSGMQETYFPDGSMEKIDIEGNTILEHEDGTKELIYHIKNNKIN